MADAERCKTCARESGTMAQWYETAGDFCTDDHPDAIVECLRLGYTRRGELLREARGALRGVLTSFEAYTHTGPDPKAEAEHDEYDAMMAPLWRAAKAMLTKLDAEVGT